MDIVERSEHLTHVALTGRLDTAGVDRLEALFNAAVVTRRRNTIVDIRGVDFLASMGLRMLLTAAKILDRSGAKLVLVAPTPLVEAAVRAAGVESLLPLAADREAACAHFGSVQA